MKTFSLLWLLLLSCTCTAQDKTETLNMEPLSENIRLLTIENKTNLLLCEGNRNILLVDAGYRKTASRIKSEILKLGKGMPQCIINTHWHNDHTGGNATLGEKAMIIGHQKATEIWYNQRETGSPTLSCIGLTDGLTIDMEGIPVHIMPLPGGHTNGDLLIHFPNQQVLALGDQLFADQFPYIDLKHGGSVSRYIAHIDQIIQHYPRQTKIVGGHGPVYNMDQLKHYQTRLKKTVHMVLQAQKEGLTMTEMQKKNILHNYNNYGKGFISKDIWIQTILSSYSD